MNPDYQLIRKLATYCAQAYERADITDAATDAAAIVTLDENDDIIVAFRGSRAPHDFIQDAKVEFTTLAYGHSAADLQSASGADISADYKSAALSPEKVHAGFLQDFEAIDLAVTSNVKTLMAATRGTRDPKSEIRDPKIYVTGHSLGGALAILCAYQFAKQNLPVAGVVTFGQPRVGNAAFCQMYDAAAVGQASSLSQTLKTAGENVGQSSSLSPNNSTAPTGTMPVLRDITFRVVNENDLVPRLPGWLMGYRHCGQEIFIRPDGRAEVNLTLTEKIIWDVIGLYGAYSHREDVLIREHFLNAYQNRIQHL